MRDKTKIVNRKIPEERENRNDNFRVRYRDKSEFGLLKVNVVRLKTGEKISFEFKSEDLPDKDSIHFTTEIVNGEFKVIWRGGFSI